MSLTESQNRRQRRLLVGLLLALSLAANIYIFLSMRADKKQHEENRIPVIQTQSISSYLQQHCGHLVGQPAERVLRVGPRNQGGLAQRTYGATYHWISPYERCAMEVQHVTRGGRCDLGVSSCDAMIGPGIIGTAAALFSAAIGGPPGSYASLAIAGIVSSYSAYEVYLCYRRHCDSRR